MSNKDARVESLDYLRGVMALSVVIYHYVSWSGGYGLLGSEHLLGKLGVYAVSMFYILSGLSLAYVYDGKIKSLSDAKKFAIKRIFRIFPLFWIVTTLALIIKFKSEINFQFPFYEAFLNYTLTFGFISPSSYFSIGAWSIGNEMVFYFILCITYLIANKFDRVIEIVTIVSIFMGIIYTFWILTPNNTLAEQWTSYINPLNQFFFFMAGVSIFRFRKHTILPLNRKSYLIIFIFSSFIFFIYPSEGDAINITTSLSRIILSASCVIFVLSVYILDPHGNNYIYRGLKTLGQISYSIYLLHPVISAILISLLKKSGINISLQIAYLVSFILVLIAGYISFNFVERPMMNISKKITNKM
ncbi:acyltransferase [Pectobacterium parmentieri]|uniref:acyltransferase family protein n=1 Tax=Pectobacterium parmentieri TaxID=1905730 RepID=UPI000EB40502|nr:acyltransferase [Pectobacterium parmentieri]AYH01386.1 hypothetical protein C5E26_10815 [Pectobacterium parmentieri]AYH27656.1 hypothetical protein C5E20_11220 [Pectobacterium parmentieri]AYH31961.1 hypothetical protein C5E19_10250 [Pectobacterium parmentieri]MBI0520854.1 acyltransferase [Pectobacterium parmentieri]RKO79957.1 hypothetical protein C5E04_11690 [Pectobacterium parmentieri]